MMKKIKNLYSDLSIKVYVKYQLLSVALLSPLYALADNDVDAPTTSPWGSGGLSSSNSDPTKTMANKFIEVLRYGALIIGALTLLGGGIYVWNTINMSKEEKEHHNVPLRILMGVAGVFMGVFLCGYAISGLSGSTS